MFPSQLDVFEEWMPLVAIGEKFGMDPKLVDEKYNDAEIDILVSFISAQSAAAKSKYK